MSEASTLPEHPPEPMTSDDFIAWSLEQPEGERYELHGGYIVRMASERWSHARTKSRFLVAMALAVQQAGLQCDVVGDGMAVQVSPEATYEPDALLRCGDPIEPTATRLTDPMVVVEVTSKSSRALDTGLKLSRYFNLPSLRHYLIVQAEDRPIIRHSRGDDGTILTRIIHAGAVELSPPGITLTGLFD